MKILLIEDEPELRQSVKQYLQQEGYLIESANDFIKASEKIEIYDYDCILVDISLPYGNGLKIIEQLKASKSKTGIIIISAKNSLDDKINGLESGADDYLTKPFHLSELNARIKALIRRKYFEGHNEVLFNEIKIIPDEHRVFINNTEVGITSKEYALLLYFIANKNRVITKFALAEHLSGDYADQTDNHDFIYTHIKNLRKKMIDKGCADYIHTVYGIGYNFTSNLSE